MSSSFISHFFHQLGGSNLFFPCGSPIAPFSRRLPMKWVGRNQEYTLASPITTPHSPRGKTWCFPTWKFSLPAQSNFPLWIVEITPWRRDRFPNQGKLTDLRLVWWGLETVESARGTLVPGSFKGGVWVSEPAKVFQKRIPSISLLPRTTIFKEQQLIHNMQPLGETRWRIQENSLYYLCNFLWIYNYSFRKG